MGVVIVEGEEVDVEERVDLRRDEINSFTVG